LIDTGWLYSIIQAGATFAAIVGAFFTTKILTIASEKRTLQNHVEQLKREISEREQEMKKAQEDVDEIEEDMAVEHIDILEDEFMSLVDVEHPPSVSDMCALFEEISNRPPDKYEKKAIERMHPRFAEQVNEEAKKKAAEKASQARIRWLEEEVKRGNIGATLELMTARMQYPVLRAWPDLSVRPPTRSVTPRDLRWLDEMYLRLREQRLLLAILAARKADYDRDLKALAFPKYIREGFIALIYLVIVGVVLPLGIAPSWYTLPDCAETLLFLLFMSGLAAMVLYLYSEVRHAIGEIKSSLARP